MARRMLLRQHLAPEGEERADVDRVGRGILEQRLRILDALGEHQVDRHLDVPRVEARRVGHRAVHAVQHHGRLEKHTRRPAVLGRRAEVDKRAAAVFVAEGISPCVEHLHVCLVVIVALVVRQP
eukprot:5681968-Prymnesium_polylepis.1